LPLSAMKALYYHAPRQLEVKEVPIPDIGPEDVLLKGIVVIDKAVDTAGVCGTDGHIHDGEFIAKFPLIPGHEIYGIVDKVGRDVTEFVVGDKCVADNATTCDKCFYCRRGQFLLCQNFDGRGVTSHGGFAEYVDLQRLYKVNNLSPEEAVLVEPLACAVHGMDRLQAPVGAEVLLIGAGPTGLLLAQLLRLNGATKVTIAANEGPKTELAKSLDCADTYVELDRADPDAQWAQLKKDHPYGFDIVVEATGSEKVADQAINYVRRGGTLLVYGVYENKARVHWPPSKIFGDEIKIIGSFAQVHCFPRAVAYLDGGKINVKGMVTDVFKLEEYEKALEKMNSRTAVKIAIKP
ncbi:GroES-like protein, partial [Punctularia strigosozonata HHB-11173 SS5]|uniref:GroES-like protein n=1 Tax=Punctularia strigosozonata (strain HHB-11173) TaxID=741275 RepID=UPI0004416915